MIFLISYGLLSYATYFEARTQSPSFRPSFRLYDQRFSLAHEHLGIKLKMHDLSRHGATYASRFGMPLKIVSKVHFLHSKAIWMDLDLRADSLDLEQLLELKKTLDRPNARQKKGQGLALPVQGTIRCLIRQLKAGDRTVQPFKAQVRLQEDGLAVTLDKETLLCGISTPGSLEINRRMLGFDLKTEAIEKNLKSTLQCLNPKLLRAEGRFNLKGGIQGHATNGDLLEAVSGHWELAVREGHIYRGVILLDLLNFLNLTGVISGQLTPSQMLKQGLGFHFFSTQASLDREKLLLKISVRF